jgi:hypothetical protein
MARQKKQNWKFKITIPEYELEAPKSVKPVEIRNLTKGLNIKILKGGKI